MLLDPKTGDESVDKPVRLGEFAENGGALHVFDDPMATGKRLRIASYNINGINSRLHVLTRWLEEFAPDVVGLQELKCTDEAFPREAIEALGYSAIWHGQKSWNGVAILSRVGDPVETRRGAARRSRPEPEPLYRGGGVRHPDRQHVCAQRQSEAGAQVRL